MKISSKFKGKHPCQNAVSVTLLKSHFSMDIILQTFCIIKEHLFIIPHLEGSFWIQRDLKSLLSLFAQFNSKKRSKINFWWKIKMTQFIGNEKINNKFDISKFIQYDVSTASCSHYQVLSWNAYNFNFFYADFNKLYVIK